MSHGLQVWDQNGLLIFEAVNRVARIHSTATVTIPANSTQFHSIPGYIDDGTWFIFFPGVFYGMKYATAINGINIQSTSGTPETVKFIVMRY